MKNHRATNRSSGNAKKKDGSRLETQGVFRTLVLVSRVAVARVTGFLDSNIAR